MHRVGSNRLNHRVRMEARQKGGSCVWVFPEVKQDATYPDVVVKLFQAARAFGPRSRSHLAASPRDVDRPLAKAITAWVCPFPSDRLRR